MIQSIHDAFRILDTEVENTPFEAIEYLREHPADPAISDKILFALNNAYNEDVYYDEAEDTWFDTPLWYAFVAEKHLSEALIEPVIALVNEEREDEESDFLNEQASYLIGQLAEKFPDQTIPRVLDELEDLVDDESDAPYPFLYEVLYFAGSTQYRERILTLFRQPALQAPEIFCCPLLALGITEAIPILEEWIILLEELIKEQGDPLDIVSKEEMEVMSKEFETGVIEDPDAIRPWFEQRGDWKEYIISMEERMEDEEDNNYDDDDDDENDDEYEDDYDDDDDDDDDELSNREGENIPYEKILETFKRPEPKVGRNDPCPCGSGKKYKDCHWGN